MLNPSRAIWAAVMTGGAVMGHHSRVMFDQEYAIERVGIVREFKFINPHALILLKVLDGTPIAVMRGK